MGRHRRPTDTSWSGAMSGMPICWAACCPEWTRYHQAAMVGHGVDPADAPRPMPGTTTSARPCCWPRCTPPGSGTWCWPARWWSTGRTATTARSTVRCAPVRGRGWISRSGGSSRAARAVIGTWCRTWSARMRRSIRAAPTLRPRLRRSSWCPRGRGRPGAWPGRWDTTTCTAPGCRETPRTPGRRRPSGPHWPVARRRRCSRTGGSAAISCRSWMCGGRADRAA
jgi:hypothetical protein